MTPDTPYEYSAEHIQLIREARHLESLMDQPGWALVERMMSQLQTQSQQDALTAPTSDPASALDVMRKWQITDEVVSSIRATILQTIQHAKDLTPENDRERDQLSQLLMKED